MKNSIESMSKKSLERLVRTLVDKGVLVLDDEETEVEKDKPLVKPNRKQRRSITPNEVAMQKTLTAAELRALAQQQNAKLLELASNVKRLVDENLMLRRELGQLQSKHRASLKAHSPILRA
jgi:hypothetical protein